MKATTILRWVIVLLLLLLITRNLLAQDLPSSGDEAYPAPPPQPTAEPYPWPTGYPRVKVWWRATAEPAVPTNTPGQKPERSIHHPEPVAQPTAFVPTTEDIARAERYREYVRARLLSDEGWWK